MIKRILLIGLVIFATYVEAMGQWQFANGPYYSDIQDLAIDPQHPDTLFAATLREKLYKTEDGGETWIEMNIDPNLTKVRTLAMAPDNPNILYAGGYVGIDKTEDGGTNWSHIDLNYDVYALAVDPTNCDVVYGGTTRGLLKSIDGGFTWESMNNGFPVDTVSGFHPWVRALAIDPVNPAVIYAGTYLGFYQYGLYKSTNAGSSWVYVRFDNQFFY
ncbi:hypothetical protein KAU04_00240, partial [bacterium]|nr:hypothetical protein [bacterium]